MKTSTLRPTRALRLGVLLSLFLLLCLEFRSAMSAEGQQPMSQEKPFVAEYHYKALGFGR